MKNLTYPKRLEPLNGASRRQGANALSRQAVRDAPAQPGRPRVSLEDGVVACPTVEDVLARTADEDVVAVPAGQCIVPIPAD